MNNLVSIIMPSYSSQSFITKSIESVLNQTYINWELIVIDDCSPDDSNLLIKKYIARDKRIKFIKLDKNSGAAVARNKGIEIAEGRYIAFLDSDDIWLPNKLEKQVKFMKKYNLSFTYSSYKLINEDNKNLGEFIAKNEITYSSMLKTSSIGCLTAIYDIKKLGKIYMPNIKRQEDYVTWLKILKKINVTKGIIEPLAIYRIHKNSASSNKLKIALYQWKTYRDIENINFFKSLYYFTNYAIHGFLKYKKHNNQ